MISVMMNVLIGVGIVGVFGYGLLIYIQNCYWCLCVRVVVDGGSSSGIEFGGIYDGFLLGSWFFGDSQGSFSDFVSCLSSDSGSSGGDCGGGDGGGGGGDQNDFNFDLV